MKKLEPLPMKPKVRAQILIMFNMYRTGDVLPTFSIVRNVRAHTGKYIKDASIDRYLRGLREDGLINYTYVGRKSDGKIKIIPMGEPHSL